MILWLVKLFSPEIYHQNHIDREKQLRMKIFRSLPESLVYSTLQNYWPKNKQWYISINLNRLH